jgi:hypothetical protein
MSADDSEHECPVGCAMPAVMLGLGAAIITRTQAADPAPRVQTGREGGA